MAAGQGSVRGMGIGNYAAADARGGVFPTMSAFWRGFRISGSWRRVGSRLYGALERPWILLPGAEPAEGGANGAGKRRVPFQLRSHSRTAGHWGLQAAAIASISFELPYAAVDGNVLRVLSRIK